MYSKEMFLKSEKISKKIKKCNYWWHFCLVYLVYLFQFCLVPLFVISVQSSDSSFVHKTGLIFLVGSFYIVSDQYSTDFSGVRICRQQVCEYVSTQISNILNIASLCSYFSLFEILEQVVCTMRISWDKDLAGRIKG